MIFKTISQQDYSITPYPVFYDYKLSYTSGSPTNTTDLSVKFCRKYNESVGTLRVPNMEFDLFNSISQSFYSPAAYVQYGIKSDSYIPSESAWVVGITQDLFGNEVVRGSFSLRVNNTASIDDGNGNLLVSGSIIGRIFYDKGIILVNPTASVGSALNAGGLAIASGTLVDVRFTSSLVLYEHHIRLRLGPDDFLVSAANPSSTAIISGSLSAASMMYQDKMKPYITSLGLYNSRNELLAVAKVSTPIQRTNQTAQTFIIKFDT